VEITCGEISRGNMLISLCLVLRPTSAFSRLKTESPRLDRASALLSFECNFAEGQRRKLLIDGSTKSVVAPVRVNILRVEQHRHEEADGHFWDRIFDSNIRSFFPHGHLMWVGRMKCQIRRRKRATAFMTTPPA
jgi:hypothetical protein